MNFGTRDGFTLVETLVAFAVAALLLTSYQQLAGQALRASSVDREREIAVLVGLSQLEALASDPHAASRQGHLDAGGAWRIETLAIASSGRGGLSLIKARFSAVDEQRRSLAELETWIVGRNDR